MGRMFGDTRQRLALATKAGNPIPNEIGASLTSNDFNKWNQTYAKYSFSLNWRQRKLPDGSYNCAGHVWGSRRTCIHDQEAILQIFGEDKFKTITENQADIGDIAVYWQAPSRDFLHAGRIVKIEKGGNIVSTIHVLSKLNDWGGEIIHRLPDLPYRQQGIPFLTEIWTDR